MHTIEGAYYGVSLQKIPANMVQRKKIHTFPSTSEDIGCVINRGHASHVVSGDRQVVGVERVLLGLHGYFVHGVIALAVNTR